MRNERGIILTITIIFIIILVIMAGAGIILMTNHALITERQIKRMKAFYTAEAAVTYIIEAFRTGLIPTIPNIETTWDGSTVPPIPIVNNLQAKVTLEASPGSGPNNSRRLTARVDY